MRRTSSGVLACALALAAVAEAAAPEGRWEGTARLPGRDLSLVVDLAPSTSGVWEGSIIIHGLGISGARLSNVVITPEGVSFDLGSALASPPHPGAAFTARLTDPASMSGEMRQGGNIAGFSLARIGPAQVEAPPRSTAVARDAEGRWTGEIELNGYPRHVTLTLQNDRARGATATLVIVGRQTTSLPVSLVVQEGENLRVEAANGVTIEGRFARGHGEIVGAFALGTVEQPMVLRRASGGAS